jgi:para-nitrobenzyl esterase
MSVRESIGEDTGFPPIFGRPVASTTSGQVRGAQDRGTLSFRGLPFAAPPIGRLRFRPPAPVPAWPGVREAVDPGPACPQIVTTDITESGNAVVDEDCLTLNVWTPALDGARRPVMVWIHGGALIEGSARNNWYNGAALATHGDVVVVTLQYRIGAFGFLYLGGVGGEEFAESGNLGLLDQVAALQWVRDNIAHFGGDPGNVTLFGESAGGACVAMLMGMPRAHGLFHKAIVQSLSPQLGRSIERSDAIAREFVRLAGVETVEQLQALRTADIIAAQDAIFSAGIPDNAFSPTIDGTVLPAHAIDRLRDGAVMAVPVLIGTTLDEMRFWTEIEDVPLLRKSHAIMERQVREVAGEHAERVGKAYGLGTPAAEHGRLQLAGDLVFRIPSIRLAEHLAPRQPMWMYLFSYRSTSRIAPYQSAHAMELPFVFGALDDPAAVAFTGRTPGRERLARQMQDAWTSFARHGVPTSDDLPDWPCYDAGARATMSFDLQSRVVGDPLSAQRLAWDGVPFDSSAPDDMAIGSLLFEAE